MAKTREVPCRLSLEEKISCFLEIMEAHQKAGKRDNTYWAYVATNIATKELVSFNHVNALGAALEAGKVYLIVSKGTKPDGSYDVKSWELENRDFKLIDQHGVEKAALIIMNGGEAPSA